MLQINVKMQNPVSNPMYADHTEEGVEKNNLNTKYKTPVSVRL